ncbi:MAG TPA: phage holin family protein [Actinomycetota bacterium]|nr:phage holin family protein [Actinomycetota bacterium]
MATQDQQPGARTTTRPDGAAPTAEPSTGELLKGLADDATTLVRQEILLARQELQEGLAKSAQASALLVAAGVLGLYAFGFLLYTIGEAIGGPRWLGFAIVTAVLLIVVTVLGLVGKNRLAASKVAPEKARAELQTTANELKEEITWGRPQRQPPER